MSGSTIEETMRHGRFDDTMRTGGCNRPSNQRYNLLQ